MSPKMSLVEIKHGDQRAGINPAVGGSLAYWRAGHDLVRPAPPGADDPGQFGCFPLVPYSNRIRDGRFEFAGQTVQLPLNFGDHPHSIHGHGWQNPWQVTEQITEQAADCVTLQYRHAADAWPFSYLAEQIFRLSDGGLSINLRLVNLGDRPMPAGLGLHPYFPTTPEARIEAAVDGAWLTDGEIMPAAWEPVPAEWDMARGCAVKCMSCDNLFTGWGGTARITWPEWGRGLTMTASPNLGYLVVYAPSGEDFFCAEPVSHCTDAFNNADGGAAGGVIILQPGKAFSASVRFQADIL